MCACVVLHYVCLTLTLYQTTHFRHVKLKAFADDTINVSKKFKSELGKKHCRKGGQEGHDGPGVTHLSLPDYDSKI